MFAAEGALRHLVALPVDNHMRLDAAGTIAEPLAAARKLQRIDLRRVSGSVPGVRLVQREVAAGQEKQAEGGAEAGKDFPRERNSVGLHWAF